MNSDSDTPSQKTDEIRKVLRYAVICALLWTLLLLALFTAEVLLEIQEHRRSIADNGRVSVSATVSENSIHVAMKNKIQDEILIFCCIWLSGLGFIWFGTRKITSIMTLLHKERDILHESEEELRVIFEASESGIIVVTPQGVIDFANRRMAGMFGMTLEELTGTLYTDHLHESEKQVGDERMRLLLKGDIQLVTLDRRYIRADGTAFWGHLSGRRLENQDGSLRALVGVISDITERKQAEDELRKTKKKYEALFTRAGDGIFILSVEGKLLEVNEAFARMHGYTSQEMMQMKLRDLDTPETFSSASDRMTRLLAGEALTFEVEHYHRDGHVIPLEVSASLISTGGESYIQCFHRDITERKRVEEALKESEFFFKESQRSAAIGSYKFDIMTDHWDSSEVLDAIFGIDKNFNRTARSWLEIVHPDDREMMDRYLREEVISRREAFSKEYRIIRQHDGAARWVYGSGVVMPDHKNRTLSLIGTIRDITERKQAEEERRQLEQQFHHAQKLESLGVLAGGIAHDFNNILTVVLGQCYLGRTELHAGQEYQAAFQQIETAANRAADLCRQMLTYAGRTEFEQTSLGLCQLVEDVVRMLQSGIKKNVTIELDLKSDVPKIKGDIGQVQQVVMNLIINAVEAIGNETGAVRVSLSKMVYGAGQKETDTFGRVIEAGVYACLEVEDTGIGMDTETQKRIFEPFYTTKFTGRGLGMSAISGIVKAHNAALLMTSSPGVGTTFRVYFRIAEADDGVDNAIAATTKSRQGSGTLLLVDDEETLRNMGQVLLETLGFSVMTAENGRDAIDIYREREGEIDLVLMDLIMPVMGGIEAYNELRRISTAIPVIICSGYSIDSVKGIIDNDEHAGFVHKPYKPGELRDVIMTMIV